MAATEKGIQVWTEDCEALTLNPEVGSYPGGPERPTK